LLIFEVVNGRGLRAALWHRHGFSLAFTPPAPGRFMSIGGHGVRAACCRFPGASLLARMRSRLRIPKRQQAAAVQVSRGNADDGFHPVTRTWPFMSIGRIPQSREVEDRWNFHPRIFVVDHGFTDICEVIDKNQKNRSPAATAIQRRPFNPAFWPGRISGPLR
jgi:hypothetical protein